MVTSRRSFVASGAVEGAPPGTAAEPTAATGTGTGTENGLPDGTEAEVAASGGAAFAGVFAPGKNVGFWPLWTCH